MMAVTYEMKAIEIPVDLITPQDQVTMRPSATLSAIATTPDSNSSEAGNVGSGIYSA